MFFNFFLLSDSGVVDSQGAGYYRQHYVHACGRQHQRAGSHARHLAYRSGHVDYQQGEEIRH